MVVQAKQLSREVTRSNPARHQETCQPKPNPPPSSESAPAISLELSVAELMLDRFRDSEVAAHDPHVTSDQAVLDRVCLALQATGYASIRHLQAYCHSGRITLQGCLPTYYLKQVAQAAVLKVVSVREFDNDVKVISSW